MCVEQFRDIEQIEIGVRWNPASGRSFFGIDQLNRRLSQGWIVESIEERNLLTAELFQDDECTEPFFSGRPFRVTLAPRRTNAVCSERA